MNTSLFSLALIVLLLMTSALPVAAASDDPPAPLNWTILDPAAAEGRVWSDVTAPYDRLPGRAEKTVPPAVWGLSHDAAGICFRFRTDSPRVGIRWTLRNESLALPHMPATGVSGVDLYVRAKPGDTWRFATCGQPKVFPDNDVVYNAPANSGAREYLLYLPLYNGVTAVAVGVESGRMLEMQRGSSIRHPAGRQRGIVFYGTSITQGACASRPGMAFTALVGRRLDTMVVNLGFSGNGKMEIALADLLTELDPDVYVLDCLRNMSVTQVAERVEPFLRRLRAARPNTPIVLLQDAFVDNPADTPRGKLVRATVEKLTKEGMTGLFYVPMRNALGKDGEGTVDNVHPNDLGMSRQADAVTDALRRHVYSARR